MNALSFTLLLAALVGILHPSRRVALIALVGSSLYLPQAASLTVLGFNLFPARILSVVAFVRILARGEFASLRFNPIDHVFLLLYVYTTATLLLVQGESAPLRIARLIDALTCFFFFRAVIRDLSDLRWLLSALLILLIPYVALVSVEFAANRNLFNLLGAQNRIWLREGRARCFGSFRHPILLGTVGASFFPFYVALAFDRAYRIRGFLGAILSLLLVFFSNSGAPLSAFAIGIVCWLFWPLREKMKLVRRSLAISVILLALIMKAPIWFLIARVTSLTGGTGWHRSYLIDVFVRNFGKWWLFGLPVENTHGWMPYNLGATGGADITNQFIAFGLNGGLVGLVAFSLIFVRCFRRLGQGLVRLRAHQMFEDERLVWACGVMLVVHMFNFLGITYFDQFSVIWFAQLAAAASASSAILSSESEVKTETEYIPEQQPPLSKCYTPA